MATHRFIKLTLLLVIGFLSGTGLYAQGWGYMGGLGLVGPTNEGNYINGVYQFEDGSYGGINHYFNYSIDCSFVWVENHNAYQFSSSNTAFIGEGNQIHHIPKSSQLLANDMLVVLEEQMPVSGYYRQLYLNLYQAQTVEAGSPHKRMQIQWHKPLYTQNPLHPRGNSIIQAPDGGFVILGSVQELPANSNRNVLVIKTDADGTPQWTKTYDTPEHDYGAQIVNATDGGYFILKTFRPESDTFRTEAHLLKIDATGNQQWEVNLSGTGNEAGLDMTATLDGALAITGVNKAAGHDAFLLKADANGNILWRRDYLMPDRGVEGRRVVEDLNGDLLVAANLIDSTNARKDIYLIKSDAAGLPLWERRIGSKSSDEAVYALIRTTDGGYLLGGVGTWDNYPLGIMYKMDVNGIIKPGRITGNVLRDRDGGCSITPSDTPLVNWTVEAFQNGNKIYFTNTDSLGNYAIPCDTGDFVVKVVYPAPYWNSCVQDVSVHVGYQDTVQIDFPVESTIDCPYLTVEHTSNFVRPCDTTTFFVHFCNNGPVTADDAYFQIDLDEAFSFLSADAPPSEQNGNLFTFPLGDLEPGECGDFKVLAIVDCEAPMGYTVCSDVHIFPDNLCTPPDPEWSGALIHLENACDGDSVRFILRNAGEQDMPAPLDYIIIEDAVLLMQNTFQLPAMQEQEIVLPANGSTYHLIAEQEPFAPGGSLQLSFVENCTASQEGGSTGYANQYPENDGDPFFSSFCTIVQTSFDPNDMQAIPTGFGAEHNIFDDTELEYTIRFQNTGNDTAFRVVLIDTLPRFLDPATLQPGASSHPYQYRLEGNGTLVFTFQHILLPDSTTNPDGSQGFVAFRIGQKAGNPIGTVINNNADIYFDFNVPVRTNTVFHTVHEPLFDDVLTTSVTDDNKLRVDAYPNPFSDQLRIQLEGVMRQDATFQLYRSNGQLARTLNLKDNQAVLQREGLEAGLYFFTVKSGGKLLGTGKVVVR